MSNIVIFGASRGLGAAIAKGLPTPADKVWLVSRGKPDYLSEEDNQLRVWIKADLTNLAGSTMADILKEIGESKIDTFIYNAGIWEENTLENLSDEEVQLIVNTNLTALLLAIKNLLSNLKRAKNAKIILIGSTAGLENEGSTSVVYATTKFAMRGVAHGLIEQLRPTNIGVTCLSLGSMATDIDFELGAEEAIRRY
jgi:short-subunit dehydrogenase